MNKTKIEWCDITWNPVWGCFNSCLYCYARKIAKRFSKSIAYKEALFFKKNVIDENGMDIYQEIKNDIYNFTPCWLESNFSKPFPKKPSRIFVNSMSDIAYWKPEWMGRVIDKIKEYPQHQFLFLSKHITAYLKYKFPKNCLSGITRTAGIGFNNNFDFISIEPIQEKIMDINNLVKYKWVIIGSETGSRKGKVIPEPKWIAEIVDYCKANKIPVFLKNSLKKIWGKELIQEFPQWER